MKVGNKVMTLKEVFESMNLTPYDLTIDMLDCHAVTSGKYKIKSDVSVSGSKYIPQI